MITLFQHGKDEPAGEIENYLRERQVPFAINRLYETGAVPEELPPALIILGGQMSVNDTDDYPFFLNEKRMIRRMVAAGKPVLGVCLGAQMIASAFRRQVFRDTREQGWVTVHGCGKESSPLFPRTFTVFHWHNETFTLPAGAVLLARGDSIENQAFRLGSAVGVQYHPEVNREIISRWAGALGPDEKKEMLRESEEYAMMNREHCHTLMDHFLGGWNP